MKPKTTLTITGLIGLVFSLVMFVAPEFVTREQFPNAEGQGFTDLVTVRYAIASLIMALVIITYHLRNIEGQAFQAHVMRGYTLAFSVVCITTLILQILGKISAIANFRKNISSTSNCRYWHYCHPFLFLMA